ncbi:hypothetical protein LBMAG33_4640 [Candidatus Levyibacteriota bacterium]|nr:hypothetical protein [Candidatus Levybacteria bacterium]GDX62154.1 hypothetical protein LBMAG33_4640 [Candidatus Levybacteria bacterium]
MNVKKSKKTQLIDTNPIEAFRNMGNDVGDSILHDFGEKSINELWNQLLSNDKNNYKSRSGDLTMGEEINLSEKKEEKKPYIEGGIDYRQEIIHGEKRIEIKENQIISSQIEQIMNEINQLMIASSELRVIFKDVSTHQKVTKTGIYHLSFFSFVLNVIKQTRKKVENSATWLKNVKNKNGKQKEKKQQNQYWEQFAEKGTSFALSSERNVATQVG